MKQTQLFVSFAVSLSFPRYSISLFFFFSFQHARDASEDLISAFVIVASEQFSVISLYFFFIWFYYGTIGEMKKIKIIKPFFFLYIINIIIIDMVVIGSFAMVMTTSPSDNLPLRDRGSRGFLTSPDKIYSQKVHIIPWSAPLTIAIILK